MTTVNLQKSDHETELLDFHVDDIELAIALKPHSLRPEGLTAGEARIREAFDALFDALQRLEHFAAAGLVHANDYAPYLRYWIKILGDPNCGRKPQVVVAAIWRYIEFYGYVDVQHFMSRFGYEVRLDRADPDLRRLLDGLDRKVLLMPRSVAASLPGADPA